MALVFVLSNNDYVLGKAKSSLVPFENLSPGGVYMVQVTAVSANGIVYPMVSSSRMQLYADGRGAQPPVDVQVETAGVTVEGVDVMISWSPDSRTMSCFYSIYWMCASSGHQGYVKLEAPLPQWRYKIGGLDYNKNYTIRIYSYENVGRVQNDSKPAITWFCTPDCLSVLDKNLTMCAPPSPEKFSALYLPTTHINSTNPSALLTWTTTQQFTTEYNYSLQYHLAPGLFSASQQEVHRVSVMLPSSRLNYTADSLLPDQVYKFYITSVSEGGSSSPSIATVYTGDIETITADSASSTLHDKAMNMQYVYAIVAIFVFSVLAGAIYRLRRAKNTSTLKASPIAMTDLDYVTDTDEIVDSFNISTRCLVLHCQLGSGAFGKVMRATVKEHKELPPTLHNNMTVAVKMLKDYATEEDKVSLLKEMKLMREVGRHPSVVSLLACSTSPPFIVIDYCSKGDLKSYLLQLREQSNTIPVFSYNSAGSSARASTLTAGYADFPHPLSPTSCSEATYPDIEVMFLSFARQIALGMEYLSAKRFVHRDLAARNVLVCDGGVVKVADFGLTRDVYENSVYKKVDGGKLPVKWMAIESIFDELYTSKSDVWSYGVVLWEIVTMGSSPYPGIGTTQLLTLLKQGYRMPQPGNCSHQMYEMMKHCWLDLPTARPTFTQLVQVLDSILEERCDYLRIEDEGIQDITK